jgi:O-acetylhomoserine (thiol)-lyase
VASEHRLALLVDATVTTPLLGRPFDQGAHLVMHSATKFLSGHGVVIGGVLVDGGRFDWTASGKFPTLTEPYEGFHGMVFTEESTTSAFLLRARREGLRDFGACMAPMTAFQILQGMETLPLRMARHIETTHQVVEFLAAHAAVERVHHPHHPAHPDHALAQRLYPRGCGAILSFELKGGRVAGRKFIESLSLFSHLANIGDAKSLVIHPASTTHQQLTDDELRAARIGPERVRLSIGLESIDDILWDLEQALEASQRTTARADHDGAGHSILSKAFGAPYQS